MIKDKEEIYFKLGLLKPKDYRENYYNIKSNEIFSTLSKYKFEYYFNHIFPFHKNEKYRQNGKTTNRIIDAIWLEYNYNKVIYVSQTKRISEINCHKYFSFKAMLFLDFQNKNTPKVIFQSEHEFYIYRFGNKITDYKIIYDLD